MTDQPVEELFSETALTAVVSETGGVTITEAQAWISRGLVRPRGRDDARGRAALAGRLALIRSLREDLGVEDASLDLVLDLIDKLRSQAERLACLEAAIDEAPERDALRRAAADIFRRRLAGGES
ncbi:MAG: hypothetical protein RIM80_05645 [Alphaproteobacteria bacterium]